jgi:hypothetical protein
MLLDMFQENGEGRVVGDVVLLLTEPKVVWVKM